MRVIDFSLSFPFQSLFFFLSFQKPSHLFCSFISFHFQLIFNNKHDKTNSFFDTYFVLKMQHITTPSPHYYQLPQARLGTSNQWGFSWACNMASHRIKGHKQQHGQKRRGQMYLISSEGYLNRKMPSSSTMCMYMSHKTLLIVANQYSKSMTHQEAITHPNQVNQSSTKSTNSQSELTHVKASKQSNIKSWLTHLHCPSSNTKNQNNFRSRGTGKHDIVFIGTYFCIFFFKAINYSRKH